MVRGKKRTKEEVQEIIKKAWNSGSDLRYQGLKNEKNLWILKAAYIYYPTWNLALNDVGLSYEEVKKRGVKKVIESRREKLTADIIEANNKGISLNSASLQKLGGKYSGLLYRSKPLYPGSDYWRQALLSAKLNPDKIILLKKYNKTKIKELLIQRNKKGLDINHATVVKEDSGLVKAIKTNFKTYDAALQYAGFNPKNIRKVSKPLTQSEIIFKIIELNTKKVNLSPSSMINNKENSRYYYAGSKLFAKGWREAVQIAGIKYIDVVKNAKKYFTKNDVLKEIQELKELEVPLNAGFISKQKRGLYKAGLRLFNSWDKTLVRANLDPKEIRKKQKAKNLEDLINDTNRLINSGESIRPKHFSKEMLKIYYSVNFKKISWTEFLLKTSVDINKINLRKNWKNKSAIIHYLINKFPSGIVESYSAYSDLNHAVSKSKKSIKYWATQANLIYAKNGKIKKEQLNISENIGILYSHNITFLTEMAKRIRNGYPHNLRRRIDYQDLTSDAFMLFLEILPTKPYNKKTREYMKEKIPKMLRKKQSKLLKETIFANETYFDLYKAN